LQRFTSVRNKIGKAPVLDTGRSRLASPQANGNLINNMIWVGRCALRRS
jgi:hypothetical protein